MTVQFIQCIVNLTLLLVTVGLPCGILWAWFEEITEGLYNHKLEVEKDEVSVYEETEVDAFISIYNLIFTDEKEEGDIEADIKIEEETVRLQLVLELAELHNDFDGAYKCLVILNYEEIVELANEVFELKAA